MKANVLQEVYLKDKKADLVWLFPLKKEESKHKSGFIKAKHRPGEDHEHQGYIQSITRTPSSQQQEDSWADIPKVAETL